MNTQRNIEHQQTTPVHTLKNEYSEGIEFVVVFLRSGFTYISIALFSILSILMWWTTCSICALSVMPNLLIMIIVVAFSNCLDFVAIEMESGMPLNYDRELKTVGWSNLGSGLSGGFIGSHILFLTSSNIRGG
ncbi:unnamed protein product, partial [Choristocarpus tenellus]